MPLELNGTTGVQGNSGAFVAGTAVASTSGTSIDFTSIPSWVKRITFMLDGVSTNGGSTIQIQLGTSSGVETTGYVSGNVYGALTTGFLTALNPAASYLQYGTQVFTKINGNSWVQNGNILTTGIAIAPVAGSKTLSGTLDRVRLTTIGGTDTFDAGTINILYE